MKSPQDSPLIISSEQEDQVKSIIMETEIIALSCVFWKMNTPGVIERRRLGNCFFYVPVVGSIHCRGNGQEKVIGPGAMLMVAENTEHEAWMASGCSYLEAYALHAHSYTHHAQPLLSFFKEPFGQLEPPAFWHRQLALLARLFNQHEAAAKKFGATFLQSLLLHQLLTGAQLTERPKAGDERIWSAVNHILRNYASPLTVADLARRTHLSEVQFRKLFQRQTGTSPKAYIQKLRLAKAKALLQTDPEMTVKEAAARTGIGDARYFHEIFRKTYGSSPGTHRNHKEP